MSRPSPVLRGGRGAATLADLLDTVRWDDDPSRRPPSPLLPAARWFEAFPWDGEEGSAAGLEPEALG